MTPNEKLIAEIERLLPSLPYDKLRLVLIFALQLVPEEGECT